MSELRSAPFVYVENGNTKDGDQASAKSTDDTADGDAEACAIDRREHLPRNDASNNTPAQLIDDVEQADNLGRPVSHEITTEDL